MLSFTHHLSPFYHFSHSLISVFISITIDNIISTVSFLSHDSHIHTIMVILQVSETCEDSRQFNDAPFWVIADHDVPDKLV